MTAVALIRPKFDQNLAQVVRACSFFDVRELWYTGRVNRTARLPRELRGLYPSVDVSCLSWLPERVLHAPDRTPIAVEFMDDAEPLFHFVHPSNALYVFGPEDGSIDSAVRAMCHRFVTIPGPHCINVAAAVHIVLYDRLVKEKTQ
jgi:tRNA(Leu) C34 or U34 (ribose-2'-O)-methylase TrmL